MRRCIFSHLPSTRYSSWLSSLNVILNQSRTSRPPLVTPHAIESLNPLITQGAPGSVAPYTFISGDTRCISYQIEGRLSWRWGSLQSKGLPDFVLLPDTAQLLEPFRSLGLSMLFSYDSSIQSWSTLDIFSPLGIDSRAAFRPV